MFKASLISLRLLDLPKRMELSYLHILYKLTHIRIIQIL